MQGELPTRDEVDIEGDMPAQQPEPAEPHEGDLSMGLSGDTGVEGGISQPEMEVSPVVSESREPATTVLPEPSAEPDDYMNIPIPDDSDDELLFGDTECF